jgi:hypothetical protein
VKEIQEELEKMKVLDETINDCGRGQVAVG